MALTYPIDYAGTLGRWWLYDTNTNQTSKMTSGTGNWPNAEGTPIAGLPANLIPLLAIAEDEPVGIDERLVRLEGQPQAPDLANNEIRTDWSIIDRSDEEKKDVVHNIEQTELGKHFDFNKLLIETVLVLGVVLRQNKNLNVPAPMMNFADTYQSKAEKIYRNRLKIKSMLDAIDANEQPILDQEFEPAE